MPCPIGVNIPGCLTLLDNMYIFGEIKTNRMFYKMYMSSDEQKASNCIECGTCEKKCPQNIPIRSMLKEVVKVFEE
jgi:predicted aldo/keto reductase-like oxidoreductase